MSSDIQERFIKIRVDETRCPDLIRAAEVRSEYVYLLRHRIDCGQWQHVSKYFVPITGKYILVEPVAARRFLTVEPRQVVASMKSRGLW